MSDLTMEVEVAYGKVDSEDEARDRRDIELSLDCEVADPPKEAKPSKHADAEELGEAADVSSPMGASSWP